MAGASEFELIDAIRERVTRAGAPPVVPGLILGSGDDAAISARAGTAVTSVDALVEGVHFRMPPFEPHDVGVKALAVALSDLAAMAAEPREAYVQLGLPERIADEQVLEIADGIGAVAGEHQVAVAGGDLSRAAELFLAITVVGEGAAASSLVRRGGARPGDLLAVTGELGGASAGLLALERPELCDGLDPAAVANLRRRQLRPQPRFAAAAALQRTGARAMIDISDGLGADAGHVAAASRARLRIDLERLPVAAGVAEIADAAGVDRLELAAGRGEDYELLVALAPGDEAEARTAVSKTGLRLTVIGDVVTGDGVELSGPGEAARLAVGFDQLAPRRARDAPD